MNVPPNPEQRPNPFQPPPVGSYVAGAYGAPSTPPPASSEAVAALVCGILGWLCFPLGFLALWLGARARRAVRDDPARVGGDQLALVGMILGGIFAGLGVLIVLLYIGIFVFAFGYGALHP